MNPLIPVKQKWKNKCIGLNYTKYYLKFPFNLVILPDLFQSQLNVNFQQQMI